MIYLFDTDTLIYFMKGHRGVLQRLQEHGEENVRLSTISIAELYYGVYHSQRVSENLKKLQSFLNEIEIFDFDTDGARIFGKTKQSLIEKKLTVDDFDLAIASIALATHSTLVTHNVQHFQKIPELVFEDWVA